MLKTQKLIQMCSFLTLETRKFESNLKVHVFVLGIQIFTISIRPSHVADNKELNPKTRFLFKFIQNATLTLKRKSGGKTLTQFQNHIETSIPL